MKRQKQGRGNQGFTIVELILASAIFSAVVLVALSGFIEIGRLFYKGANLTQNQQTARTIVDKVSDDISATQTISKLQSASQNRKYYCIGNARYTFILGKKVDITNHDNATKFALLRDKLVGSNSCANPFDGSAAVPIKDDAVELLGNKMRLNAFCVVRNNTVNYGRLYTVSVNVITGDDKVLSFNSNPSPSACAATTLAACNSTLSISQYCASSNLDTSVAAISSAPEDTPQPCPSGFSGTYPNCIPPPPPPQTCPSGYSGTYPNCVPPPCPSGYSGTYPNCQPPPKYTLTITFGGQGGGNVYYDTGKNCPNTACVITYDAGTAISLFANTDSDSRLRYFAGTSCGGGVNPCNFTINSDMTVRAIIDLR